MKKYFSVLLILLIFILGTPNNSNAFEKPGQKTAIEIPSNGSSEILANSSMGWMQVNSPVSVNLESISMLSTDDGWAVGNAGTILRWNSNTWEIYPSPTQLPILSVYALAPDNAWAVDGNQILHWDGESWEFVSDAPQPFALKSVYARNASDVWFAGGYAICNPECYDFVGKIMHWDGANWQTYYSQHKELYSIFATSATNAWTVGRYFLTAGVSPVIAKWNGSSWLDDTHPEAYGFYDVSALNDSNAWVVGADNITSDCMTIKWDGVSWTQYPCPAGFTNRLYSVDMLGGDDVWAAGGDIIHWNGSVWSRATYGRSVKSIDMVSHTDGWAVGYYGQIFRYTTIYNSYLPMISR